MSSIKDILKKDYPKIQHDESITKAAPLMKKTEGIVIMNGNNYESMLIKRDISKAKITPETKVKTFSKNVAKLTKDDTLETTAALMLESDSYVLPIFENDKLIGIITAQALLKKAAQTKFGEEPIKQYITSPVINISANEPVSKAIKIFKEQDISRLPVYENNHLTGIITMDDTIARFIHPEHKQRGSGQYEDTSKFGTIMADKKTNLDLPIKGIMSDTVQIMHPDETVQKIVNTMFQHQYRGMLIGIKNNIQGIVTKRDLLEPLATSTIIEPIVIQFSGELNQIQNFNKQRPKEIIYANFSKYLEFLDNAYIYVRLKRHTEQSKGKHIIFCKMRLSSPRGMFIASEEGWGYLDAINKACTAIEKQIRKEKEK